MLNVAMLVALEKPRSWSSISTRDPHA